MKVTVNVVDCAHGRPAEGVAGRLEQRLGGVWTELAKGRTDERGAISWDGMPSPGRCLYRLELDIDQYFATLGIVPSHPWVTVVFRVLDPGADQHIPVLMTPHAHMTYGIR